MNSIFLLILVCFFQIKLCAKPYAWESVNLQGMGFVTGLLAHPAAENLVYAKTDVGGIYRWNLKDSSWIPLLDGKKIGFEIESMALSNSDTNQIYIATDSNIYSSNDRGENWNKLSLKVWMNGNGDWRQAGERLAVDPNGNGNVLFFGSRKNGLWKSTNSGTDWIRIDATVLPSGGDAGIAFVVFDKSSGDAITASSRIFAGVMGAGIFLSTDGGVHWALLPSGPALDFRPIAGAVASNGAA